MRWPSSGETGAKGRKEEERKQREGKRRPERVLGGPRGGIRGAPGRGRGPGEILNCLRFAHPAEGGWEWAPALCTLGHRASTAQAFWLKILEHGRPPP